MDTSLNTMLRKAIFEEFSGVCFRGPNEMRSDVIVAALLFPLNLFFWISGFNDFTESTGKFTIVLKKFAILGQLVPDEDAALAFAWLVFDCGAFIGSSFFSKSRSDLDSAQTFSFSELHGEGTYFLLLYISFAR